MCNVCLSRIHSCKFDRVRGDKLHFHFSILLSTYVTDYLFFDDKAIVRDQGDHFVSFHV